MAREKREKKEWMLFWGEQEKSALDISWRVHLRLVQRVDGKVRNLDTDHGLEGLVFLVRAYSDCPGAADITFVDLHYVDMQELEARTKALRSVFRKLDKMNEKMGYPASVGESVSRFAAALGIKSVVVPSNTRGFYDEMNLTYLTVGQARHKLERWIEEKAEKVTA